MFPLCLLLCFRHLCAASKDIIITHVFVYDFETHVRKTSAFMKWFSYSFLKECFKFFYNLYDFM